MHEWANRADSAKMHRRAFSMEKRIDRLKRDGTARPKAERRISRGLKPRTFRSGVVMARGLRFAFGSRSILKGWISL